MTIRSASGYGSGASSTPLKMLNTAVVTPIPSARATMASVEMNRDRRIDRTAALMSRKSRDMAVRRERGAPRLRPADGSPSGRHRLALDSQYRLAGGGSEPIGGEGLLQRRERVLCPRADRAECHRDA